MTRRSGNYPRNIATGVLLAMVMVAAAGAQEPIQLPELTVSPPSQPRAKGGNNQGNGSGTGADDKGGDAKALDRLNRELKRKVDEVNPTINSPPLDARSPDTKIGIINIPGVQQQYGKNFGNSVVPYRPPSPVYAPLGHR